MGRHDFLFTPCSPETFAILYKTPGHHPSCFENLLAQPPAVRHPAGHDPHHLQHLHERRRRSPSGELKIVPPRSRPGDSIVLRAEMDLIVGVTACSAEMSNNCRFKPIDLEILT